MSLAKKIFLTSSIILLVILLLWGVYIISFQKPASLDSAINTLSDTTAITDIVASKSPTILALTDEAIISPTLSADGNAIKYYSKATGKAFELNISNNTTRSISNRELVNLSSINWSSDRSRVISTFPIDSLSSKFFYYDYTQNKGVQLKDNLDTVTWQSNNKIIYKYFNPKTKERTLNIADPDGSNWEKIINLTLKNISIAAIPKTGLISFWSKPDSFNKTLLQSVPIFGGELKTIASEKFGADYLWSSDGNMLLESSVETSGGLKMQLGIMNNSGGEYKTLGIPTLVSKCAWSKNNKNIYYALPGSIPSDATMPNDYNTHKITTNDTFWMVNTTTGEKTRLVDLDKITQAYDATNLFLNSDESMLFFLNKIDGKLYRISL
ncbi:MAG: hypothetical protein UT50_C0003G0009 [Candidatus Moranbacteria bacterium GW2011_GWA2_39_41]|nr:MAG: hypothetical protein UT50_C0003G0009 [Candidatus Moranbacteria bacterium GW2011_GWA2_39_41]